MENYQRYFKTKEEAKEAQKTVGGKIKEIWTYGENGEPLLVYELTYKQLF